MENQINNYQNTKGKKNSSKKAIIGIVLILLVGALVGGGFAAYHLIKGDKVKETKAAQEVVYPNGGAVAYNVGDLCALKVIGGKNKNGNYLRFVIENRLGVKDGKQKELKDTIMKKMHEKNGGYVVLPLKYSDKGNWKDVLTASLAEKINSQGKLKILPQHPGWYAGFPNEEIWKYRKSNFQEFTKKGFDLCAYFAYSRERIEKWQKSSSGIGVEKIVINLDQSTINLLKNKYGRDHLTKMSTYKTYFFSNSPSYKEYCYAAGKPGLKAPSSFSGSYNASSSKVTLKWNKLSGLNAYKYHLVFRLAGKQNWEHVATLNYPKEQFSYFERGEGKTFEYQIRAVSYFDSSVEAYGPIITVKIGINSPSHPINFVY